MSIIKYKDGDQWASILTVKGDQGEPGPQGPPGPEGPQGPAGPAGGVTDVQVNGTSITNEGVANIPFASASTHGVFKIGGGVQVNANSGNMYTDPANSANIDSRANQYKPIVPFNLDYAVKAALCDGVGPAYSAAEQAAARARLGVGDLSFHELDATLKYADITADLAANKLPVLVGYDTGEVAWYAYTRTLDNNYYFTCASSAGAQRQIMLRTDDVAQRLTVSFASLSDEQKSNQTWVSNDTRYPTTAAADARYELKGQGGGGAVVTVGVTTYDEFEDLLNDGTPFTVWETGTQLMYAGPDGSGNYLFWGWAPMSISQWKSNDEGYVPDWGQLDSDCFNWLSLRPDPDPDDNYWYRYWLGD